MFGISLGTGIMLQGRTTKRVFKKVAQIWNVDLRWNDIQVAHGDTEGIVKDQKLLQRHHLVAETPHSGYSGSGSGGSILGWNVREGISVLKHQPEIAIT